MKHIMAAVDGSPASLAALHWASTLAQRTNAKLSALRVWRPDQMVVEGEGHEQLRAAAHDELDGWCSDLDLSVAPATAVAQGDPASGLLDAVSRQNVDLLVVGPRGAGGFRNLRLGSVTSYLAHHTTVPLAIVPTAAASWTIDHIVVGTDGSDGSAAAVRFCAGLAPQLEVPVTAVLAREPFLEWVPESDPTGWRRTAEKQVREWTSPIIDAGVKVDVAIDRDVHPVPALARAVEANPANCLTIVGARGRGGFAGLLLGRVPLQLVQHTDTPVVVVPADQIRGRTP